MNNRFLIAVCAVVAVALVAVLSVVLIKPGTTDETSPTGEIAMTDRTERATPETTDARPESTDRRTAEASEGRAAEAAPEAQAPESVVALPDDFDEDDEFASVFADYDLFDEEDVAKLLEEYGSIKAIYDLATKEEREDLIDMLMGEDLLRDEIASLLPGETDPELRLYMIDRVDPRNFYDDSDEYDDYVDTDLLDLLNQPTATPITEDEWLARMDLAHLIEDAEGYRWAQQGKRAFPNSDEVQLLGNVITLNVAASVDNVVPRGEATSAMEFVYSQVFGENALSRFDPFDRMQAYNSVYPFDPTGVVDPQRTLDYYRQQMQHETDPRALEMLADLEGRLLQRYGTQLAANTDNGEQE